MIFKLYYFGPPDQDKIKKKECSKKLAKTIVSPKYSNVFWLDKLL